MCDPCASVLSCCSDHLLPLAREHLLPILNEAFNIIRCVPNDEITDKLKRELETIEESIHQADELADAEGHPVDGTREKIKQQIKASFRIQDAIDEYINRDEQQLPDPGCAVGLADNLKSKILRLQMAHNIQNIKSRINRIRDSSSEKAPEGTSSFATNPKLTSLQNQRIAPFNMAETEVVGFEKPRKKLVDWLVTGRTDLTVVSVVAIGGQGKTTLAKKVFDSKEVFKHFDCRVWITVSKSNKIEVLRDMLEELCKQQQVDPPQNIEKMTRDSLIGEVQNYLQGKRYVVVFDDVWDSNFWDYIQYAMIDGKKGRRILITTTKMEVAIASRTSSFVEIHELESLPYQQSLELFNKKAFHDLNGCCPENLVDVSSEFVKKCSGLPLAIVVIGGLLSCKDREPFEWYNFSKNINLELKEDPNMKFFLGLSYHDLPYNLKSCLLYFGLYPKHCIVPSKILIQQWIAEGFVKEDRRRTLEEVAKGYLTELIRRSLVQVHLTSIDGRAKSCRVHDLVHAMILTKCEDLSFCQNISEDKQSSLPGMVRRLSIATNSDNLIESIESSQVRSLLVYGPNTFSLVRRIPTKCRSLKVLNFEYERMVEVPKDLGSLSNLKYFRLGMRRLRRKYSLPKSIGMLSNLETLDLDDTSLTKLPKEICKLRKLRHLIGFHMSLIQLKDCIGDMTSLQTLSHIYLPDGGDENDNRVVELIEELGKLKQLRKLGLLGVKNKYISAICSSIDEMQQLEELCIRKIRYTFRDADLNSLSRVPPMLRIVKLDLMLEKFPEWISKLQNLVKLTVNLKHSQLDDVMELLQGMPTLLSLKISRYGDETRSEKSLHFQNGWFKNLKELSVRSFAALNCILIDEGALGSLQKLQLYSLPQIKKIPIGILHLKKLESLILVQMSLDFKRILIPNAGKEHWIFKQVPFVEVY